MFARFDDAVLEFVERVSHQIQVRYGLTCFWQARVCHILTLVLVAGVATQSPALLWPILAPVGSFSWMYATMVWGWYTKMEEHYAGFPDVGHPNTLRWREEQAPSRLTMLAGIACAVAYGLWHLNGPERLAIGFAALMLCWVTAQYLQCCIPLPPGAHRDYVEAREQRKALAAAERLGAHSPV